MRLRIVFFLLLISACGYSQGSRPFFALGKYTTIQTPNITSFTPTSAAPGATVTLTGSNFTGTTTVTFGGVNAASFNVISNTTIDAVVASGSSGNVSVTNAFGTANLAGFTFIAVPTISGFTPTSAGNGTVVTITGTNFTGASAVTFGGTNATSYTVVSPTSITATVASGTSGSVAVTTSFGTATLAGFTFLPPPTISSFTPTTQVTTAHVTITGTNFTGATAVSFGGYAAGSFSVTNSTTIDAVVGVGASGSVSVTTGGGTALLAGFTYSSPYTSILSFYTYTGSDQALVYVPAAAQPSGGWPVIFWYHGNGERGTPVSTFDNIGTGNGSQTVFSGNLTNSNARVLHTSVVVKVNGVQVATGINGVISGAGVTGTYGRNTDSNAAYSVTFSTPPTSGHIVRIDYIKSNLIKASYPSFLNSGDAPLGAIIVCPQISRGIGGFDATTEWDNVITMLSSNFTINSNKFYVTGLSLGGDMCHTILTFRNSAFAAYIAAATGSGANIPSGGNALWTNTHKRGKRYIQGSADGTGFLSAQATMSNNNANNTTNLFPVLSTMYWNIGHSASLWDDKCFNRKNRTDATGLAPFDFIDWFLLFDLDDTKQADNFVTLAESTFDIYDYRIALKVTNILSAGAPKTALLSRLSTLKSTIGAWVHVDFGTSFRSTTTDVNYNNITSASAGTIVSNMKNDNGVTTTFDINLVAKTAATATMVDDINSGRTQGQTFGLEYYTNRDGMLVESGTTGTIRLEGLNSGQLYTIRLLAANGSPTYATEATITATVNGQTKTMYTDCVNTGFIEWTSVPEVSGNITISSVTVTAARSTYIQNISFKQQ